MTSSTDGTKKAYQTLADAIQNAGSGDTVTLSSGTYELEEDACIVLNKKLTIEGAGDKTVIKGSGRQDYQNGLFTFTGGSEGSVLKDLTIEYTSFGAQRAADYFDYGFTKGNNDNVTKIQNVKFVGSAEDENRDNEKALAVSSTYMEGGFIEITGCDFKNFAYGMYFNRVHDLTVKDNTIDGTKYNAINIAGDNGACENIVIQGNTMTDISYGNYADALYSSGISLGQDVSNVTIEANTIEMLHNKQPIYVQKAEGGETKTVTVTYQVEDSDNAVLIVPVTDGKACMLLLPIRKPLKGFTFAGWDYGTVEATLKTSGFPPAW